ncbi:MAG: CopG family transcriptional regulator [Acidobacteria bacterium]|nr:CopG family transcriptional regulator [Acidobacteriota bacterium]
MRTTVEISDEQRARLLALAAARGEKGFSKLVQEALDLYLEEIEGAERGARIERALASIGSVSDEVAERMSRVSREIRESWR